MWGEVMSQVVLSDLLRAAKVSGFLLPASPFDFINFSDCFGDFTSFGVRTKFSLKIYEQLQGKF